MINHKDNQFNKLYFRLAVEFEKQFVEILFKNQVHFRGNLNSLSLISISEDKPELGVTCRMHTHWTESIVQSYIDKIIDKPEPKRATPEKSLQAWIIRKSLENKHLLPFNKSIRFITSEFAIQDDIKGKIVSDILGYDVKMNRLVILELKSARHLSRLIEQVNNMEYIVNKYPSFFEELVGLHGYQIKNDPLKTIIWPKPKRFSLSDLKARNIVEYVYEKEGNNYVIMPVG